MSTDVQRDRLLSSEEAFVGKLLRVRVDHVQAPDGHPSVREVVEHPGAVAIVALTEDDEVILVRQWRHAARRELLEIPAGTREEGEPEEETARRELAEETGYVAARIERVTHFFSSAGYSDEQVTIFLATGCDGGEKTGDPSEGTEVVLIPRKELAVCFQPGPNEVNDAQTLIGLLWLLRGDQPDLSASPECAEVS